MNILKLTRVIAVLTSFFYFSCQVESVDPALLNQANSSLNNNSTNSASFFKVDFNSQTWTANTTQTIVNSSYIAITAQKSTGEFFQITIPNGTVGTYTITSANPNAFVLAYSTSSGSVPYLAVDDSSGVFSGFPNYTNTALITISSIDTVNKKITGTFKFTGVRFVSGSSTQVETKVFTNGSFNLDYVANTPGTPSNSFTAKLDGNNYVPTNVNGVKSLGLITIVGRKGSIESIGVTVPDNAAAGSVHNFTSFSSNARGQYVDASSGIFGGSGTTTIISHDIANKRIKGTFDFNASTLFPPITTHNITQGTFDVTYQ